MRKRRQSVQRKKSRASHVSAMIIGIVASGVLFFPVAPLFLFMHGKYITIPKGTEASGFINGDFVLDMTKFIPPAPVLIKGETQVINNAEISVLSIPLGADIELDGAFVGSTPSTTSATI